MIKSLISKVLSGCDKYECSLFNYLYLLILGLFTFSLKCFLNIFIKININYIDSSRIGHFVIDSFRFVELKRKIKKSKFFYFFCLNNKIANKFFFLSLKKKLNFSNNPLLLSIIVFVDFLEFFNIKIKLSNLRSRSHKYEDWELFENNSNLINFSKLEEQKGFDLLRDKFGIKNNNKFICLLVRDGAYLNDHNSKYQYRNYEIESFHEACKALSDLGYYVIRMGKKVQKETKIPGYKFIDYASSSYRSDFLDFFLIKNCTYVISTTTGIDTVAYMFNKPICYIVLALGYINFNRKNNFWLPSVFIDHNSKKISLPEMFKKNLIFTNKKEDYLKADVIPLQSNSKEIKDFAIEMHNYLLNKETISTENLLQVKFWDIYKKYFIKSNYFNNFYKTKFKNNTRISNSFLKRNSEWFLND